MSDEKGGLGSGILRGLKNLLFTDSESSGEERVKPSPAPVITTEPPPAIKSVTPQPVVATVSATGDTRDMKLKVYQLLESLNQPGCDFFEVWNAATEMGGANAVNIKAAFTSLRFADATLTKDKLVQTGQQYKTSLQQILDTETRKRQEEKNDLQRQEEQAKANLQQSIAQLEQQIASLQQQLTAQKTEADTIHSKYQPVINELETKMAAGLQSVNGVIAEMDQVLTIIQRELN